MVDILEAVRSTGLSQGDVAEEIGISRQHLYEIVRRKADPTAPVIARLLSFLNRPENLAAAGRSEPFRFEELFGEAA